MLYNIIFWKNHWPKCFCVSTLPVTSFRAMLSMLPLWMKKTWKRYQGLHIPGVICHISSKKKKETGFQANVYHCIWGLLNTRWWKHNLKIKNAIKIIYQMISDVIQTSKYGRVTKENAFMQILLRIKTLLCTSNA